MQDNLNRDNTSNAYFMKVGKVTAKKLSPSPTQGEPASAAKVPVKLPGR